MDEIQPLNKKSFISLIIKYIIILIFYLLIILVMIFLISPISKVQTISVKENQMVYDQEIINSSDLKKNDSIIEVFKNKEKIKDKINKTNPQISDVFIEFKNINEVILKIKEYETVAYIFKDGSYLRVLENGTVLDKKYNISLGNQPILTKFEEGKTLDLMISELDKLDKSIMDLISEVEQLDKENNPLLIKAYMNNGNQVISSIPTFSDKILYYPEMVDAVDGKKGIFNIEAGAFFIPFKNEENDEEGIEESQQEELENYNN